MLKISRSLFEDWNVKICYIHWKSNEHLVPGLQGDTDLDVLADINDKEKVNESLGRLGFLFCKSQFGSRYPGVEDWIGFDSETGKLIHLHLHFKIVTGHSGLKEYNLPWTELALNTRVLDGETEVYTMEPNLEIVTLFSRIGLKATTKQLWEAQKGKFSSSELKHYNEEIVWLRERVDWNKVSGLLKEYYTDDADTILEMMRGEEGMTSANFIILHKLALKHLGRYSRYGRLRLFFLKIYYQIALLIRSRLRYKLNCNLITRKTPDSQQGMTIAFMGQDGAGKSTVTKAIEKWLTWKLDARQFYLGSGDQYQPWEKKLAVKLHGSNNPIAKLIRKWLPFSYLSKLGKKVYQTILTANKYASKGGIVLYDRYPQTKYEGINDGPKIRATIMKRATGVLRPIADYYARREEKYIRKAVVYSPNVVVKLMLSPEESIRRKPHENYEMVKQKHKIIKDLEFSNAAIHVVDATLPYEQELIEIKNIVWNHLIERSNGRRNLSGNC